MTEPQNIRWLLAAFLSLMLVLGAGSEAAGESDTVFQQTFGGPGTERGIFVTPTRDGGYAIVGFTTSEGAGGEDVYLVKTDAEGRRQWARTYGGEAADNGWAVVEVDDGFVIAGFTESFGAGENDFYLVKTDEQGEESWSRTYGGAGNDRCWTLVRPAAGGFLLAGETTSEGQGEQDCWLVRTDDAGEKIWSRTFGGTRGDRVFAAANAPDGGFVLAGQTFSEGAGDRDAYVVATDADGNLRWSRTFGGAESDVAHGIDATRDGAFLVTGYTTSFAQGGDDPFLVKIDAKGDTLWTRVVPLDGNNHTITGVAARDGGFFLTGFTEFRGWTPIAALVVKCDENGRREWHRNLSASAVGESYGYTVRATADGGCVLSGHAAVESRRNLDVLLVKLASGEPGTKQGGSE
jgi:hypothetical protein